MKHHTEAERAEFEAWINGQQHAIPGWIAYDTSKDNDGDYLDEVVAVAWLSWYAACRAPAAPVPQGWKLVPIEPTPAMQGSALTYVQRMHQTRDVYSAMLSAAPQQPEAEENPLQEQLDEALQSLEFYKRRCDLLQSIQTRMRDPERTMVCDVLANGHLLQGGDGQPDKARYAPPEAAPVQLPEPVAFALEWTFNGEERGMRLYDDETHCRFDAESDGGVCHPLYTEQQVRDLLAAHGIGKDKA